MKYRRAVFSVVLLIMLSCETRINRPCPSPPAGNTTGMISTSTGGLLVEQKSGASVQLDSGYHSQDLTITIQSLALADSDVRFRPDSTILQKPAPFIIPSGYSARVGDQWSIRYVP